MQINQKMGLDNGPKNINTQDPNSSSPELYKEVLMDLDKIENKKQGLSNLKQKHIATFEFSSSSSSSNSIPRRRKSTSKKLKLLEINNRNSSQSHSVLSHQDKVQTSKHSQESSYD